MRRVPHLRNLAVAFAVIFGILFASGAWRSAGTETIDVGVAHAASHNRPAAIPLQIAIPTLDVDDDTLTGIPGQVVPYTFHITNDGDTTGTFNVSVAPA